MGTVGLWGIGTGCGGSSGDGDGGEEVAGVAELCHRKSHNLPKRQMRRSSMGNWIKMLKLNSSMD